MSCQLQGYSDTFLYGFPQLVYKILMKKTSLNTVQRRYFAESLIATIEISRQFTIIKLSVMGVRIYIFRILQYLWEDILKKVHIQFLQYQLAP